MINFLSNQNISIDDVGFAKIDHDIPTMSHENENLDGIKPRMYCWSKVMQYFPYFRLYLITEGEMNLTLNTGDLHMKAGNMYLIHPMSIKKAYAPKYILHYFIHFNIQSAPFNLFDYYGANNCIPCIDEDLNLFKSILASYNKSTVRDELKASGAFQILFSRFFSETSTYKPEMEKFMPVLKYIEKNICSQITINELANIMHINKIYFVNLFSKTFKLSPLKYIIEKRMLLAQKMLLNTQYSIAEIAERLGYPNEYYFSSTFKRILGLPPTKWRKIYFTKNDL